MSVATDIRCAVDGCEKTSIFCAGMCNAHYNRWRREVRAEQMIGYDADGTRICSKCNQSGGTDSFYNGSAKCKACTAEQVKAYGRTPKGRAVRQRAAHAHQIRLRGHTPEMYDELLAKQHGLCAICNQPETQRTKSGRLRALSFDHDHETGAPRGLLCDACNFVLGRAGDDPERLESAARYLRSHRG